MTLSTTSNTTVQQGNGTNTVWNYSFLIPEAADLVLTVTTIADGTTSVIDPSLYTVTGLGNANGGAVTYPLSGSPLSSAYNISVQRILDLTQETDLVNQSAFYPGVVEGEFDTLTMQIQQLQQEIDQALAFPVGASATSIPTLMTAILNAAANATAAAASATAAAASAASILALLPLATANIAAKAVTTAKIADNAVGTLQLANALAAQVTMINGTITESHATNAVTFAVKTLAGADPSATDPVIFIFRDVTAGLGDFTVITRTTAMSFTISAGSLMGTTNSVAFRLWLVVFNDSGTLRLGAINCLSGTNIYQLRGFGIASAVAEGGAGAADSAQVFYAGATVTSKAFGVVAYASYETGLGTAGNWTAAPTRIQLFGLGVPLPGAILQVRENYTGAVATGTTVIPYDDTIPQVAEGDSYMTQAITPDSASNLLQIDMGGNFSNNGGSNGATTLVNTDYDAANCLTARAQNFVATAQVISTITHRRIANRVTATTFSMRMGCAAGTNTFNGTGGGRKLGGQEGSFMRVTEIMV